MIADALTAKVLETVHLNDGMLVLQQLQLVVRDAE